MQANGEDRANVDHTKDSEITILLPPIEMSLEEQRALGYMPLRDDFEREYKNDAETLLSNLVMSATEDDETDVEVKLTLIKMYRQCLAERQRLKKIARQYGLINNASALINKNRLELALDNHHGDSATEPTPQPSRGRKRKTSDAKTTG
jgi:transcriptional adapter 2-beta